jgi:hypothetical protein
MMMVRMGLIGVAAGLLLGLSPGATAKKHIVCQETTT